MMTRYPGRSRRPGRAACLALALALATSSCAYYNTFYLAKKYYDKGTAGLPYPVDKPNPANVQNFTKSVTYSKKLLSAYPKHKLVDDAYLLWAQALLGADDPRQSIALLEEFPTRFPNSSLKDEAAFYLGVAYRQARKYNLSLAELDTFLVMSPRHRLAPYAYLERARALMTLDRPEEAGVAADELIQRFPKSELVDRARVARAEARFAGGLHDLARGDFHELGSRARTDEERLGYLLREADCLEAARKYEDELVLLRDALAHERAPAVRDTSAARGGFPVSNEFDAYGRLLVRVGTAELMAGRQDKALDAYRRVVRDYRGSGLAAEAQYRVGYAYERLGDDFDRARSEYARVSEHGGGSNFVTQASQRIANLDRLAQFRTAAGDSADQRAEAGFLLAELYLFQLDKPERALEEYRKIATDLAGTPQAAKALNAQGWVMRRKLKQEAAAESLFWAVVRQYPATEAQIAARDYLETEGVNVPSELIKMPERQLARADTLRGLEPPPETPTALGSPPGFPAGRDSVTLFPPRLPGLALQPGPGLPPSGTPTLRGEPPFPSTNPARLGAPRASVGRAPSGGRDTTATPRVPPAPADTSQDRR
jgi:TolA-binding protein